MFVTSTQAMAFALKSSHVLVHRMIDDLKPHEFEHQPMPGVNCAAWILGHLALTDRRQLTWLGVANLPPLPDGFEERFTQTRKAAEKQSGLGDPAAIVAQFDLHRKLLIDCLETVPKGKFSEPTPLKRPMFDDVGEATLYMALHTSMHVGQITLIRRSLGYPPLG